ncbi:MAG: GLPGLI family protein [Flavobacteriaceae bacterium]|nr:MAG: GLPGLI family protein [Flavobacteriaceae bacterium]
MKNIITIFLLFNLNFLIGQVTKVEYYTFTKNTIDTTGIKTYLLFDKHKSLFVWKSTTQKTKKLKEVSNEKGNEIKIKKIFLDTIGTRVFNNYLDNKFILREPFLEENFKVIDGKSVINWKLTNEKKFIGSVKCQKAEGYYRGRNYIVWFTEEYPVPTGPWKLNGLPGLILEAHDEKHEVNFIFKKLYKCQNCIDKINIEIGTDTISIKEFVTKKDNFYNKMIKETLSKLPRGTKIIESSFKKRKGIETEFEWEEETKKD